MKNILILLLFISVNIFVSCEKFLDKKPDKKILIPKNLQDIQALLDATPILNNSSYNGLAEMGTDDYWLTSEALNGLTDFEKNVYKWDSEVVFGKPQESAHWKQEYEVVLYSNTILEELEQIRDDGKEANQLRGAALFFRAFAFYNLTQVYAPVYYENSRDKLGIPLKLSSNFNNKTVRSSLKETYDQILQDVTLSFDLLPIKSDFPTRPNKAAAAALLARVYLSMSNYKEALKFAETALSYTSELIDYNEIEVNLPMPFSRFNKETIFYAYSTGSGILNPSRANINQQLLDQYESEDLRRVLFFNQKSPNQWSFKAGYHGLLNNTYFIGLATDELYLILAECYARERNIAKSLKALNFLLKHRYNKDYFTEFYTEDDFVLLKKVLEERRKQLLFRGVRWTDLRRLNLEPAFEVKLQRINEDGSLNDNFSLPPNDKRYVYPIPQEVVKLTGVEQNVR